MWLSTIQEAEMKSVSVLRWELYGSDILNNESNKSIG